MKLVINKDELKHDKKNSVYNHNFYFFKKANSDKSLLEICHEDLGFYEYRLVGKDSVFLGCCEIDENTDTEITIDFQVFYT